MFCPEVVLCKGLQTYTNNKKGKARKSFKHDRGDVNLGLRKTNIFFYHFL